MARHGYNVAWLLLSALALAVVIGWAVEPVFAQSAFEKLAMPGKLIKGHAKLESDCKNCHSPFAPKAQNELCLGCHKAVANDITTKRGFHGLRKDVEGAPCRTCHADHKGPDADIIGLDTALFDHANSNFALTGKHATTACESCHKPGKKYREAPSACVDCHRASEPHRGQLGTKCESCHGTKSWSDLKEFDHSKTDFALVGRHKDVACRACHAGERYKGVPKACVECHRQRDVHQDRNGSKCDTCHKPHGWRELAFDHDKHTKFPLLGKHQPLACDKCHQKDPHVVRLETTCISCHRKDDVHKGELGKDCLKCHGEASWKTDTKFDHDLSKFPLLGKHAKAKCADCHKTKIYKDTPTACAKCHDDDKPHEGRPGHEGRLGPDCGKCHGVSDWKKAAFDHGKTKFALTGRHTSLGCYACHAKRHQEKATLPTDCYSCHKSRDQHRGAFGKNCGKCHTTTTFGTAYIRK